MAPGPSADRSVVIRVLGLLVRLRLEGTSGAALEQAITTAWSRCVEPDQPCDIELLVLLDPDPEVATAARLTADLAGDSLEQVMEALSPLVTITAITACAGTAIMLHAGAVADPASGRTVALVGPSGAGKTTAVRALARTYGYVTDETLAVRGDGSVIAYPKPLSIIEAGRNHKVQVSGDDLGLVVPPADVRLVQVLLLLRDGSDPPRLESIAPVQALALLAPETSYLSRLERPLHQLAAAVGPAGLLSVHYADASQLPAVVDGILEDAL